MFLAGIAHILYLYAPLFLKFFRKTLAQIWLFVLNCVITCGYRQVRGLMIKKSYDIDIVGGALTGTTLAIALKNLSLKVALIESQALSQINSNSTIQDTR